MVPGQLVTLCISGSIEVSAKWKYFIYICSNIDCKHKSTNQMVLNIRSLSLIYIFLLKVCMLLLSAVIFSCIYNWTNSWLIWHWTQGLKTIHYSYFSSVCWHSGLALLVTSGMNLFNYFIPIIQKGFSFLN